MRIQQGSQSSDPIQSNSWMDPIRIQLCRAHILANILEHSAAERHVGIVNICYRETYEDHASLHAVILSLNLW